MFPGDGDHGRVVRVLVRVHPRDDQRLIVHGVLPFFRVSQWEVSARADRSKQRQAPHGAVSQVEGHALNGCFQYQRQGV